jgi:hypothetical protein
MITEKRMEVFANAVCKGVVLSFHLYVRNRGWTYLEGRGLWVDSNGNEISHSTLFTVYLNACETTTYVTKNSKESEVL